MLTAEHKVTRWKSGRKVERWELKDPAQKRNEAFDVRNYATAALEISNPPGLEIPGEDAQRPAQQRQYRRRRSGGI
jgi:phage terminase large subunit GpA-like protein